MKKILVIDDSVTSRMFYRDTLEGTGFEVDEAINGLEGLEKIMGQGFDLIVVDLNMPKMNGYAFLAQLRRDVDFQGTPAIMISTEAQDQDRVKAYAAGANFYVIKPVDPMALADLARLMTGVSQDRRKSA